jgi:hypothetical protein
LDREGFSVRINKRRSSILDCEIKRFVRRCILSTISSVGTGQPHKRRPNFDSLNPFLAKQGGSPAEIIAPRIEG